MPDDPYTLADLSRLADVTPRTVRYYVAQGLLPSPEAAGPSTRYGEGHLARLRLIKRLQRDHLPLAEIRLRLEGMGDDEVIATVLALDPAEPEPSRDPADTLGFIRGLMARSGVRPTTAPSAGRHFLQMDADAVDADLASTAAPRAALAAPPPPAASMSAPAHTPAAAADLAPLAMTVPDATPGPRQGPVRSTWERLVIAPDVELHVRRPLDRATNKRVDQLERIARELFDDT